MPQSPSCQSIRGIAYSSQREFPPPYKTRLAQYSSKTKRSLSVLGPLVLAADLFLLLGREVVGDVEGFADLLGTLALDHVGDGLTPNVEEGFDVEVVGSLGNISRQPAVPTRCASNVAYQNDLEQHLLVDLHELLVPLVDLGGLLAAIRLLILAGCGVALVMLAPLDDLAQDRFGDLGYM